MKCLGFEGTAHTASVGIVDQNCKVLANEKHSVHTQSGGLIPRELAEHHGKHFPGLLKRALEKSKTNWNEIDCVAFSKGPGIGNALSITAVAARTVALLHNKPLVPVNHAISHIEIAKKKCSAKDPLILYVSGGNSQVIGFEAGFYRVYGETLDIGVGNLLDSFGREIGIGFPAGPKIDEMFFKGKKFVELPYSVKGMDLAFSGLLTAAENKIGKVDESDLAYSIMHTAFAMLLEVCERALAHTGKKELLLTGGVASSKALQQMALQMCKQRGVKLKVCPQQFCTDNAAMVCWTGILMFKSGRTVAIAESKIEQKFRTDAEKISWI